MHPGCEAVHHRKTCQDSASLNVCALPVTQLARGKSSLYAWSKCRSGNQLLLHVKPATPQLEWNPAPLDGEEFLFRKAEGSQQVTKLPARDGSTPVEAIKGAVHAWEAILNPH